MTTTDDGGTRSLGASNLLALAVVAAAAGWLAGVSASPVASTVVAAVVGLGGVLVSALSGLSFEGEIAGSKVRLGRKPVSAWPLAIFAAVLAIAALGGIVTRTSGTLDRSAKTDPLDHLAENIAKQKAAWMGAGFTDEKELLRLLLASNTGSAIAGAPPLPVDQSGALMAASQPLCATLAAATTHDQFNDLLGSADPAVLPFIPLIKLTGEEGAPLWVQKFCPSQS